MVDMKQAVNKKLGIHQYLSILRTVDMAKQKASRQAILDCFDAEFREQYCRYFKMSRFLNETEIDGYFDVFADMILVSKTQPLVLSDVLNKLKDITNPQRFLYSFATKMMACIDPSLPIWDSTVAKQSKIYLYRPQQKDGHLKYADDSYEKLKGWIASIEASSEMSEISENFSRLLGKDEADEISNFKKIDFCIWWNRGDDDSKSK